MFSCLTVNAQLPYFNDKMLLESRKALLFFRPESQMVTVALITIWVVGR